MVPTSRTGWAGVALTVLLVLAAGTAVVRLVRGRARVTGLAALVVCWGVGYGLAVLSWAAPGALGWLAANVPGCVVKVDETAGHMGSDPEQEIAENLRWLRDGVPPRGSR